MTLKDYEEKKVSDPECNAITERKIHLFLLECGPTKPSVLASHCGYTNKGTRKFAYAVSHLKKTKKVMNTTDGSLKLTPLGLTNAKAFSNSTRRSIHSTNSLVGATPSTATSHPRFPATGSASAFRAASSVHSTDILVGAPAAGSASASNAASPSSLAGTTSTSAAPHHSSLPAAGAASASNAASPSRLAGNTSTSAATHHSSLLAAGSVSASGAASRTSLVGLTLPATSHRSLPAAGSTAAASETACDTSAEKIKTVEMKVIYKGNYHCIIADGNRTVDSLEQELANRFRVPKHRILLKDKFGNRFGDKMEPQEIGPSPLLLMDVFGFHQNEKEPNPVIKSKASKTAGKTDPESKESKIAIKLVCAGDDDFEDVELIFETSLSTLVRTVLMKGQAAFRKRGEVFHVVFVREAPPGECIRAGTMDKTLGDLDLKPESVFIFKKVGKKKRGLKDASDGQASKKQKA